MCFGVLILTEITETGKNQMNAETLSLGKNFKDIFSTTSISIADWNLEVQSGQFKVPSHRDIDSKVA